MESSWSNNLLVLYKCSTNYLVISTSLAALAVVFVFLWKDSAIFDRFKRKQNILSQNDETSKNESNGDKVEEDTEKNVVEPSLMSRIKTARHQFIVNKLTANMTEEQLQEEKEVEKAQLEAIFNLLKEQQEKFQVGSVDQLQDQLNLYR